MTMFTEKSVLRRVVRFQQQYHVYEDYVFSGALIKKISGGAHFVGPTFVVFVFDKKSLFFFKFRP